MAHTIAIYGIAFLSVLFVGGLNLFDNEFNKKSDSGIARSRGVARSASAAVLAHDLELESHL
jgi:hypothetical protein